MFEIDPVNETLAILFNVLHTEVDVVPLLGHCLRILLDPMIYALEQFVELVETTHKHEAIGPPYCRIEAVIEEPG